MNETPKMVRRQMDQTKTQLADKFESLEHQVAATVQSTGSAVGSTAGAVQETFETVTKAVHDVAHSVTNALDIRRQIDRHPWLVLGGAVVLGYLAVDFLTAGKAKTKLPPQMPFPTPPSANDGNVESGRPGVESPANATADPASCESVHERSSWEQLRDTTIASLISVVPGIASNVVPRMVDRLIDCWDGSRTKSSDHFGGNPQDPLRHNESSEAIQSLPITSSDNVRSRESF